MPIGRSMLLIINTHTHTPCRQKRTHPPIKRQQFVFVFKQAAETEGNNHQTQHREQQPSMDENRIESQRFIDVALREINAGNYELAMKLLNKAKQLHPCSQADELQDLIVKLHANGQNAAAARERQEKNSGGGTPTPNQSAFTSASGAATTTASASASASASTSRNESPTRLRQRKSSATATGHGSSATDYTKEQVELVRRLNRCKNFYQVLGVSRDATDSEIKRAYKRLALQLHPDKNQAPGAVEAFKLLGTAVAVLTDERKRKDYDASGADTLSTNGSSTSVHGRSQQRYYHNNHGSFEANFGDDISAEELFNIFFGTFSSQGTHGHGGQQRRAYQTANQRQPQEHSQQPSLAFGLILVLILISMFSSFFTSDPVYSLAQSSKYPIRRDTQHLSVPYYVKNSFESDYQGSLGRLENSVEEDFIYTMKQNCYRERSYREAMMARARSFGSSMKFAQAQALKMPSCDKLSKIGITRYSLY